VLANLLPGLREIRAPIVSGYMWLVFFFLVLHSDLPTRDNASSAVQPLFELGDRLSVLGIATVASVAAYLVGSAMQEVLKLVGRSVPRRKTFYGEAGTHTTERGRQNLHGSVRMRVKGIVQSLFEVALAPGEREIARAPETDEVIAELPLVRTMLLGEHPELVGELDRLQAEADLRITVAFPLAALAIYLAIEASPGWLFALAPAVLLLLQGRQRLRETGDFLTRVLQIGRADTPSVKAFEVSVKAALDQTELEWKLKGEMDGDGMAAFRYGNLLASAFRFEQAVAPLEAAAENGVVQAHAELGTVWESLGKEDKAERAYQDGAKRGDARARERFSQFLRDRNRSEEALVAERGDEDTGGEKREPVQAQAGERPSAGDEDARVAKYLEGVDKGEPKAALNLGLVYRALERLDDAATAFRKAIELDAKDARAWTELGWTEQERLRLGPAREAFEEALAVNRASLGPEDLEVAASMGDLANTLRVQGDYARAHTLAEEALEIQKRELPPASPTLGRTFGTLGSTLRMLGRLEEARAAQQRSLKIKEEAFGPDSSVVAGAMDNLANVLGDLGDYRTARDLHERGLAIEERERGPDHFRTGISHLSLGEVLAEMGELDRAKKHQERGLEIMEEALGPDHLEVARARSLLGATLARREESERAARILDEALASKEGFLGENHPDLVGTLNSLGDVLLGLGQASRSEDIRRRALGIAESGQARSWERGVVLRGLGETLAAMGRTREAAETFEEAVRKLEESFPGGHPEIPKTFDAWSDALERTGDLSAAQEYRERADELRRRLE
jgi:tetratricopeptide (TPR) repeat protein